ncbi:hypothetical protein OIV83_005841 [Microbotryomycetes sp. JL201]|nr:hypothetical protein OIV83_005841 [Microbotryomycetes sp. JL201]
MSSRIPDTFKAAQFDKPGDTLRINTVQMKQPSTGEVLVQVLACGASMYDKITQQNYMGTTKYPATPGQEMIGKVCAIGPGVTEWKTDDIVVMTLSVAWIVKSTASSSTLKESVTRPGGYAQYCLLRAEACGRVPNDMRLEWPMMTVLCGVASSVYTCLKDMKLPQASPVAIHAEGGRAHLAGAMACAMGYHVVMIGRDRSVLPSSPAADNDPKDGPGSSALEMMTRSASFIPMSKNIGQDLMKHHGGHHGGHRGGVCAILCLMPGVEHVESMLEGLRPNGHLIMFAPAREDKLALPTIPLVSQRRSICGFPASTPLDLEKCFELVKLHSDCFKQVIRVEKYKLEDAQKAFDAAMDCNAKAKPVLCINC